jgi:hypothetical protein
MIGQLQKRKNYEYIKTLLEERGYSLLSGEYIDCKSPFKIRCPKGHTCIHQWRTIKNRARCGQCYNEHRIPTIDKIRTKIQEENYVLISTEYKRATAKLFMLCSEKHKCNISWNKFQDGIRCRICSHHRRNKEKEWTIEEIRDFLEKDGSGYQLLSNTYVGAHDKIQLKCKSGHDYFVAWTSFQQGHRCPKCCCICSRAEQEIYKLYEHLNPEERNRSAIDPLEIDVYFPTQKVGIEHCGLYWHSDAAPGSRMIPIYHRNKMDLCTKQNIHLLTIFEDEWLNHKEICISRINSALGIVQNKIFARKCSSKQIPNKEAYEFLKRNHLQGSGSCKIAYGLFYNNKLVQVMTFGSPARAHTAKGKKVLEMKRLAGELNTIITGGASKLFKLGLDYAKQNGYEIVKSYCDLRWGTGNLYAKLGFIKTHETKYTPHYTNGTKRFRNQNLAQNKQKTGTTEKEIASKRGLYKIYDCGHQTWEHNI